MGRYYEGDIEGKFWFAVQSSGSADRFGCEGTQPLYLEYFFWKDEHYDLIVEELASIKNKLGEDFNIIDEFFTLNISYTKQKIVDYFATKYNRIITIDDLDFIISEYADYLLGEKIREYLEDEDLCQFTAEL